MHTVSIVHGSAAIGASTWVPREWPALATHYSAWPSHLLASFSKNTQFQQYYKGTEYLDDTLIAHIHNGPIYVEL